LLIFKDETTKDASQTVIQGNGQAAETTSEGANMKKNGDTASYNPPADVEKSQQV